MSIWPQAMSCLRPSSEVDLVSHDFQLKRTTAGTTDRRGLSGTVRLADGGPAAQCEIYAAVPTPGWFVDSDKHGRYSDVAKAVARSDGTFRLPSIFPLEAVVVVHEFGYGWATAQKAAAEGITLQKWAEIEGVLRVGSKPGQNEEIILQFRLPFRPSGPELPWDHIAKTNADGTFAFRRVPGGEAA